MFRFLESFGNDKSLLFFMFFLYFVTVILEQWCRRREKQKHEK